MRLAAALILSLTAVGALAEEPQAYDFKPAGWPDGTPQYGFIGESADGVDWVRSPDSSGFIYEGDDAYWVRQPQETTEYQDGNDPITR